MNRFVLKHITNKYDVVSFDIFDTLIERDVSKPSDIFKSVGQDVLGQENAEIFCQDRKIAEQKARTLKQGREVTIYEIYEQLKSSYEQNYEELMHTEINREINGCHQKKEVADTLKECLKKGKKVYLISDMYLPHNVIEKMLLHCDIKNYNELYISNVYGMNKLSGELFDFVITQNHINPKRMIHIGDSIKADFLGAHKARIKVILIGRKSRFERLICS